MTDSHTYKATCQKFTLNRAAIKPRHGAPDTVPPSQSGQNLIYSVSIYC